MDISTSELAGEPQGAQQTTTNTESSTTIVEQSLENHDVEKAKASHEQDAPKSDIVILDWDGPDDPANPLNWSILKRALHIAPVAMLGLAVTAGSSLITPSIFDIAEHFHVSREAAILSLTVYVLGLGLGPVIGAPLSEVFGRSIVYKITAPVYLLFIMGAGFSTDSFGGLLVCRFLAGMSGGPCLAVGAGTMADMFPNHVRAVPSGIYVMAPFLGSAVGPVLGGFVAYYKGWQWTQWTTIFLGLIALLMGLPMQETYKKVILRRRALSRGIPQPPALSKGVLKVLIGVTLVRPLVFLVREPVVLLFSLYNAFAFGTLFAFFAAYPYVFEKVYHFNTWQYGLTFIGIAVGVLLAVVTAITIDRMIYPKLYKKIVAQGLQGVAPENRLYVGMVGSFGITIGLFWFAWTARPGVHWIWPTLAGILFAWGNLAIFIGGGLYLIDMYGPLGGASAMAANGLLRYGFAACFPLFTVQMYERLGIAWATSLLGFCSLALLPIPWVFFKYGPGFRSRSVYGVTR